jgi:sulfur carrier protein
MTITLNGKPAETTAQTLAAALVEWGYGEKRIATSVNEAFVPATAREKLHLKAGDRVEVLTPRHGG